VVTVPNNNNETTSEISTPNETMDSIALSTGAATTTATTGSTSTPQQSVQLQLPTPGHGNSIFVVPRPLQQQTSLTAQEFQSKMEEFEGLLQQCHAGIARTLLTIWAILVVMTFVATHMLPGLWSSWTASGSRAPWFLLLGFWFTQGVLLTALLSWQRRAVHRLCQQVNQLFRPWRRRYNINIAFYQTTHVMVEKKRGGEDADVTRTTTTARQLDRRSHQPFQGSFNFVLVFGLIRPEDIEALELASLDGTAKMEDEDESSRNVGI
jgi:hypothetical protein